MAIYSDQTTLSDWQKEIAPLSQPIKSKTKTRVLLAQCFPRFVLATCIFLKFSLVHWIACVLGDWPECLLWFWFYDTHLKTAYGGCYKLKYLIPQRTFEGCPDNDTNHLTMVFKMNVSSARLRGYH